MSDVLQDARLLALDDVPEAIELELYVNDRDVIAALSNYPEGPARDDYALEALKIGVLALRRASTAFDADFIQRETTRLVESLREKLDHHAQAAHERLSQSLREYFDPNEGRFSERVRLLTADDGQLATLLRGLIDGDDSRLSKTMLAHLGENSPLLKWLSPDQSQGLLCALRTNVESQLKSQREQLLREFSLDNADGALCRLVCELTSKHGDLSKDIQSKIDAVVKEFSLDEENSALSRLVRNVDRAQRTITNEFSLDNEQSALRRLKSELTTILEAHVKTNAEFQEEVKVALAKLVTRRETELRSTSHGATFQNAVFEFIDRYAQRRGDVAEDTGNCTGLIKNCKVGDAIITLGADCAAAGARIVFEAKEESRVTLRMAHEEIEQARKNRNAQQGVFVFSKRTAPQIDSLTRHGCDVIVVWDAEDPQTDVFLQAAIDMSRALCLRSTADAERSKVDLLPIDRALLDIEKRVQNLDQIKTSAERIRSSSDTILERVRIDREALEKQLAILRESMHQVREALGAADEVPA
ncbi:MAG TPA: hypothetical protein VEQ85_02185 [Lacipirellulaceae bacterium]|nr:hypothetical protein [Lacipirellulaceae bacterium]